MRRFFASLFLLNVAISIYIAGWLDSTLLGEWALLYTKTIIDQMKKA